MWVRLGSLILLAGLCAWAQSSESPDVVGPPISLKQELVGPPSPCEALPIEPEPQFPLPNIPLLDQELEKIVQAPTDLDSVIPTPEAVVRSILGFVFLLALIYVAGHPRVADIERRLGIAHLTTTGLPFVLLGLIAAQRSVGVLWGDERPWHLLDAAAGHHPPPRRLRERGNHGARPHGCTER
jgi:hypothetical protein